MKGQQGRDYGRGNNRTRSCPGRGPISCWLQPGFVSINQGATGVAVNQLSLVA